MGGRGIGRATAELLASRGARVMAVTRSETELAATGMSYVVADLGGTPVGCDYVVAETEQWLGPAGVHQINCRAGGGAFRQRLQRLKIRVTGIDTVSGCRRRRGGSTGQVWQERAALYRAGRVVTPLEVAEMITFLAAEESSGVSGESFRVALGSCC